MTCKQNIGHLFLRCVTPIYNVACFLCGSGPVPKKSAGSWHFNSLINVKGRDCSIKVQYVYSSY